MLTEPRADGATQESNEERLARVHDLFLEAQRLLGRKQAEEALIAIRGILHECPDQPDALNLASVALGQLNMHEEAEKISRDALRQRPDDPGFLLNLANRLKDQGRPDEAIDAYARALEGAPHHVSILKSYLDCLIHQKRWSDAAPIADRLSPIVDDNGELLIKCAGVYLHLYNYPEALDLHRQALALEPERLIWLLQAARLAVNLDRLELAKEFGQRVLDLEDNPEMHAMFASIMHRERNLEAMAEHLDAIPDGTLQDANAANLRGMLLASQVDIREGLAEMDKTRVLAPDDFVLQCTRMMYLNYDPERSREAIFDEHRAFAKTFGQTLPIVDRTRIGLPRDPDRKLHIGIVSPDLGCHSVAFFVWPFLEAFDRDRFEVTAYANLPNEDSASEALRGFVTNWRKVFHLSDQQLVDQIMEDEVDILIDLAGLTKDNRLRAFTARPAPIQMTYIGYPNTTGLDAIDYRITDGIADPDGADDLFAETLIRLPGCFLCYAIPSHAPPVAPPPFERNGYVTFGTFNNFAKINDRLLALWADVLKAVPNARLFCKSRSSGDPTAQREISERLGAHGIAPERIECAGFADAVQDHLALYGDVDIALDTFPYHGTTTTCEALWMGVPVVTLLGDRHASRVSASILSAIGFPAGIAESPEDYVLTAKLLAENPNLLKTTRATMRSTMVHSSLCDNVAHARKLEEAFRTVWRMWCEEQDQPRS